MSNTPAKRSDSGLTKEQEASRRRANRRRIYDALPKAINKIVDLIEHPDPKYALPAAQYIVDQAMGKPKAQVEIDDDSKMAAGALFAALSEAQRLREQQAASQVPGGETIEGVYTIDENINEDSRFDDEEEDGAGAIQYDE